MSRNWPDLTPHAQAQAPAIPRQIPAAKRAIVTSTRVAWIPPFEPSIGKVH